MGKRLDRLKEHEHEERLSKDLESAKTCLAQLRAEGFTLERYIGVIILTPSGRLTEERRQIIRALKPHLLALLLIEDAQRPSP